MILKKSRLAATFTSDITIQDECLVKDTLFSKTHAIYSRHQIYDRCKLHLNTYCIHVSVVKDSSFWY